MATRWARPSVTRQDVIKGRLRGLASFDAAVARIGRPALIENALAIARKWPGTWGPLSCWSQFRWGLGQAWRQALGIDECTSDFNIDEALTPDEMDYVRSELGITEPLDFGTPRRNGIRYHHCRRHDNPEKYAIR